MGGSKPTPPTIIMPEESNPQAFQTIIPQKSYKDLAESMGRTEKEDRYEARSCISPPLFLAPISAAVPTVSYL